MVAIKIFILDVENHHRGPGLSIYMVINSVDLGVLFVGMLLEIAPSHVSQHH